MDLVELAPGVYHLRFPVGNACFGHGDPLTEDAATRLRAAASAR